MPNQIDGSGIQTKSYAQIVTDIVEGTPDVQGLKQIFGSDINVESNSPDGQFVAIFALAQKDVLDLITQVYNSKDPDQAIGADLDAVSQLCGITRKGGTYTEVNVEVTTDRSLNLSGQDTSSPFTIEDSNGNQFQLITSASLSSGVNTLLFRSVNIGAVQVQANTLTVLSTTVLGVLSVNNPSTPTQTGVDQETDAEFRLRRKKSVAIPSQGMQSGLVGALSNLSDVTEAIVYENTGDSVDADGVPGHSIWVIVDGGSDADVADLIYLYRNAGCGMYGGTSVFVTQVDGSSFEILFDRVVEESLYIFLRLESIESGSIDNDAVKDGIVAAYELGIYDPADITTITSLIKDIDPTLVVTECLVSKDKVTYGSSVLPSSKKNKFTLTAANISIISSGGSSSSSSSSS